MMMNNMREQSSNENETENNNEDQGYDVEETKEIPEFTTEELQVAINRLKRGRKQRNQNRRHQNVRCRNERNVETHLHSTKC